MDPLLLSRSLMEYKRFFPGPQGTGAAIVVPMTDFSLPEVDDDRLTQEALANIVERTAHTRARLRGHNFAQGNKIACELGIRKEQTTKDDIPVELHGGPTLRDEFSFTFRLPQTPATLRNVPQDIRALLEIYADKQMGGNASNVQRNLVHIAGADIGPERHHVFSAADRYLDAWLEDHLQDARGTRFTRHELTGIQSRFGVALPYDDGGKIQQFSINTPQGSTLEPMRQHIETLRGLDHVVVSEGIGGLLKDARVEIRQIFNPTSALHTESALEVRRRMEDRGEWQDTPIINDDEMNSWIKTMEERQDTGKREQLPDAKFPMPFLLDNMVAIDENAVQILRTSHRRFLALGNPPETEHMTLVTGIGCGPKGGQNLFQCRGRYYVAAASTPTDKGAAHILGQCGDEAGHQLRLGIRDVVGAGDAAFTASLMQQFYKLEDIIDARHPHLSEERRRIATMAFTTLLQRVFGELVYHSKARDLSGVPQDAFPRLFDMTLDKAIAAAHEITMIDKAPSRVYRDADWDMSFMVMELNR